MNRGYERISRICPNCGVVSDMLNGNLDIKIVGEKHLRKGSTNNYEIVISSKALKKISGYLSLILVDGDKDGFVIKNQEQLVTVIPNIDNSFQYTLSVSSSVKPHHYWLRSYFVANGEIYYFGDNIWIG